VIDEEEINKKTLRLEKLERLKIRAENGETNFKSKKNRDQVCSIDNKMDSRYLVQENKLLYKTPNFVKLNSRRDSLNYLLPSSPRPNPVPLRGL
jgi:hypothetical protein